MLLELRDRLRRHGPQSVAELQAGMGLSEPVVRDMLARWMAKGRVVRLDGGTTCSRCGRQGRCSGAAGGRFEIYGWLDDDEATRPPASRARTAVVPPATIGGPPPDPEAIATRCRDEDR